MDWGLPPSLAFWQLHQHWSMNPVEGAIGPFLPPGPLHQADAPLFQLLLTACGCILLMADFYKGSCLCWGMPREMCFSEEGSPQLRNDGYWGTKRLPPHVRG